MLLLPLKNYNEGAEKKTIKEKKKRERENSPQPKDFAHRWAGLFATSLDESGAAPLPRL